MRKEELRRRDGRGKQEPELEEGPSQVNRAETGTHTRLGLAPGELEGNFLFCGLRAQGS